MKLKNYNKINKWGITKEFIIQEYVKKKKSLVKVAREIGIPYETLYWYKKKFGIHSYSASFWMKGKRNSPKTEFKKGQVPWNKSTKGLMKAWNKGKKLSETYKEKISISTKKSLSNPQIRNKISQRTKEAMKNPEIIKKTKRTQFKGGHAPWNKGIQTGLKPRKGKKHSIITKKKISQKVKETLNIPEIKNKIQKTQFKEGIIPWNKGKNGVYSEETIQQIRKARLKQIFPKKSTNIELILFDILNELNVKFKKHKAVKMICQADAFIEPNIILFADGDYWHCNPRVYKKPKTPAQIKNMKRDKLANSKLIKEGYVVHRFWEHDLINNKERCIGSIKELVKR